MKTLPTGMQAHLDTGATTLSYCWKLTKRDGEPFGFTDHDRPLNFDGIVFQPATGFTATTMESSLGLAIDNMSALGALSSSALNENQLAAGDFDDADIEIYRVNWNDVTQRILLRKGNLGEVKRGRTGFEAEIRGLAHRLNQPTGRLYQFGCDVDLGSIRCGVNLSDAQFMATGAITTIIAQRRTFEASGLDTYASAWFERGGLTFTSGANQTRKMEVKHHRVTASSITIELWQEMPDDFSPGDGFSITAGCDKQFFTCKNKFSNGDNFRGFPHMPGNDFVLSTPNRSDKNDGLSRLS